MRYVSGMDASPLPAATGLAPLDEQAGPLDPVPVDRVGDPALEWHELRVLRDRQQLGGRGTGLRPCCRGDDASTPGRADGRCRNHRAPSTAVDSGSSAVTTAPCVLGTCRSASASARDDDVIACRFVGGILRNEDDTLVSRGGSKGLKIYDELKRDAHAGAVLAKRKLAVTSRPWLADHLAQVNWTEVPPTKGGATKGDAAAEAAKAFMKAPCTPGEDASTTSATMSSAAMMARVVSGEAMEKTYWTSPRRGRSFYQPALHHHQRLPMPRRFVALSALLCTASLLGAPRIIGAQPTIRQIDGAPFAATIVAAPAANAVAFVLNARGVRNIWVTDSTRPDARQVTAFTQDDGQDITSLAFSADGSTLAVGAPRESSSGTGVDGVSNNAARSSGAVYVYARSGASWASSSACSFSSHPHPYGRSNPRADGRSR